MFKPKAQLNTRFKFIDIFIRNAFASSPVTTMFAFPPDPFFVAMEIR
jgi:hypothetical protein